MLESIVGLRVLIAGANILNYYDAGDCADTLAAIGTKSQMTADWIHCSTDAGLSIDGVPLLALRSLNNVVSIDVLYLIKQCSLYQRCK